LHNLHAVYKKLVDGRGLYDTNGNKAGHSRKALKYYRP